MSSKKNKEISDSISHLVSLALDILIIKNPQRTSIGVLLGLILWQLTELFRPAFTSISWIMDVSRLNWYGYTILGLGIVYLPHIFKIIFRPTVLDESIETAFLVIKRAQKAGLSKKEIGQMYLDLSQSVLKNTILKEDVKKQLTEEEKEEKASVE